MVPECKFESNDRTTYEELCIKFSKQLIRNLVLNFQNFLVIQSFPFFLNFFLVFPGAFENYWEIQKMTSPMHQLDSFCYRKPPPQFEIEGYYVDT
ncbi:Uncharacterized protein FWK35_00021604, partial [Aphis craccivora]